jgi:hypothetical protein
MRLAISGESHPLGLIVMGEGLRNWRGLIAVRRFWEFDVTEEDLTGLSMIPEPLIPEMDEDVETHE